MFERDFFPWGSMRVGGERVRLTARGWFVILLLKSVLAVGFVWLLFVVVPGIP